MTDEQSKDDGNTFQTGPDIVKPVATPRTDAEWQRDAKPKDVSFTVWCSRGWDFARQLERELAAAQQRINELEAMLVIYGHKQT